MQIRHRLRALRSQLRSCAFVSVAALLPLISQAGPLVLEEVAKLTSPDPSYAFGGRVAVDANAVIVVGSRPSSDPSLTSGIDQAAFLFERTSSGDWAFVRKLLEVSQDCAAYCVDMSVAANGGIAAVAVGSVYVFERTGGEWVRVPSEGASDSTDVEVHSGMILASSGTGLYEADLYEKQPSGTWTKTRTFTGPFRGGEDDEFRGGDVDITSDRVILGFPGTLPGPTDAPGAVHIWNRNPDGSWPIAATAIVPGPSGPGSPFADYVTIEGDRAIASAVPRSGPYVLWENGSWSIARNLVRPDHLIAGRSFYMELLNGIAPVGYAEDPHRGENAGSVAVFRRNENGEFEYVAKLLASDASAGTALGLDVEISNRTVVAGSNGAAYVFELPADLSQPALVEDNFEDGNAAEWTPIAGSTFSVASNGSTFFYRQSSLAGDAGSSRTMLDWTNQAIEADVIARAYATGAGQRWFGLAVRQTDPGNYYYLTVRNSNVVQLRKLENGVISVLASASLPVALNRPYKLRLEAVGTWIRGYVDGRLRVQARDRTHSHGVPGIRMFKTAADYDNVVMTPNARLTLFSDNFEPGGPSNWDVRDGVWDKATDGTQVFAQFSLAGDARATAAAQADDQVIQVRAKATAFAPGGERWFGVLARVSGLDNYYYLTVRNSNTVSLRKLLNGTIVVLDSAALPVSVGTWYTLRLEVIGNSLRAYVNGRLLLEANDSSHQEGSYGLATFKTSARFDDVVVTQP